jgi:cobalamin biosynthesis Mg chelatase CobN
MIHTIRRSRLALLIMSILVLIFAVLFGLPTDASATDKGKPNDKKIVICHPVEGKGPNGTGWVQIDVSKKSVHFKDGKAKHVTKDGRKDFILDKSKQAFCHGPAHTPSTTTSTTTGGTPSTTTTTSPSSTSTTTTSSTTSTTSSTTTATVPPSSTTTSSTPTSTETVTTTRPAPVVTRTVAPRAPVATTPAAVADTPLAELPRTGAYTRTLLWVAGFLIVLGLLAWFLTRRNP